MGYRRRKYARAPKVTLAIIWRVARVPSEIPFWLHCYCASKCTKMWLRVRMSILLFSSFYLSLSLLLASPLALALVILSIKCKYVIIVSIWVGHEMFMRKCDDRCRHCHSLLRMHSAHIAHGTSTYTTHTCTVIDLLFGVIIMTRTDWRFQLLMLWRLWWQKSSMEEIAWNTEWRFR